MARRKSDPRVHALSRADQSRESVSGRIWVAGLSEPIIEAFTAIPMARTGALVLVWDEKRRVYAVETSDTMAQGHAAGRDYHR